MTRLSSIMLPARLRLIRMITLNPCESASSSTDSRTAFEHCLPFGPRTSLGPTTASDTVVLARAGASKRVMGVGGSYLDALGDPVVRAALDEIPQGFAYYDAEDRCRLWNRPYAEMWRQWGLDLVAGTAFIDMLRAGVAGGRYPQAPRPRGRPGSPSASPAAPPPATPARSKDPTAFCYRMEQRAHARRRPYHHRHRHQRGKLKAATRALQLARDRRRGGERWPSPNS